MRRTKEVHACTGSRSHAGADAGRQAVGVLLLPAVFPRAVCETSHAHKAHSRIKDVERLLIVLLLRIGKVIRQPHLDAACVCVSCRMQGHEV